MFKLAAAFSLALGAYAQLGNTVGKTEVVKPIDKLQLDARSPMVKWSGDDQSNGTTALTWSALSCRLAGCMADCPETDFCRAAAGGSEATVEFNFTGSAITIYGNVWQDETMGDLVGLTDMGDVTVTINGEVKPPSKLSNAAGQLAKVDLNGQVNQTNIKFTFRPQRFMTINMIDVVLPTVQLDGKEVQQEDLSPKYPNIDESYKFPTLDSSDHFKGLLTAAGVTISPGGDFKSGAMFGDGLGDYVLINPSMPAERAIPANSYYAILKGPRSERQSDCWVVWDPKPIGADQVQHSFGYSPKNYTDAADMSAVMLDPNQKYTMRIFSQGNRPWGCLFQKLIVYQTAEKRSPLPDVTETHAPTIDATGVANGNGTTAGKSSSGGANIGAIVGGVVGGVCGGLLLAGLILGCCWWRNRKDKQRTRGHTQNVSSGSDMTHRSGAPVLRRWGSHTTVESLATSLDSQSNYGDEEHRQSFPDMALDDAVLPSQSPSTSGAPSFAHSSGVSRTPSSRPTTSSYGTQYTSANSHSTFGTTNHQDHSQTSYNSVRPSSEYENQQAMLNPNSSGRRLI